MTAPDTPSLSEALARAERAERKWQEYERDYILPCFRWAEELGYDLHQAVRDNPGRNCVDLFVRWLRGQALAAKSLAESLDGPFDSYPLTGTMCSVCLEFQRQTPGGVSCPQGHGGADPVVKP